MVTPPIEEPPPLRNTEVQSPLPLPLPNIPVGGRLAHFAQNWAKITDDEWVLSLVRKAGFALPIAICAICEEKIIVAQEL